MGAEIVDSGDLTGEDKALKAMVKAKEEIAQKDKELDQEVGRSTHSTASHSSTHSTALHSSTHSSALQAAPTAPQPYPQQCIAYVAAMV